VIDRFAPDVMPDDPMIVEAIENARHFGADRLARFTEVSRS
jgi:hypothetical protein